MIKLIASDLDGTLIGHDFRFRPRTLRALEAARAAGIDIVFVTGRPSRWLTPLREQTDFDSYAICSNGAVVYHLGANEVEEVNGADPAVIARAHELLEPMFPDATYTLETVDTVYIQGDVYKRQVVLCTLPGAGIPPIRFHMVESIPE